MEILQRSEMIKEISEDSATAIEMSQHLVAFSLDLNTMIREWKIKFTSKTLT